MNSDSDSDFDPRAEENEMVTSNGNKITNDLFGFEPPKSLGQQLFSTGSFTNGSLNGMSAFNGPPVSPPPLCKYKLLIEKSQVKIFLLKSPKFPYKSSNRNFSTFDKF